MKISNEARVGLMITISFTVFISIVALLAKINVSRSGYEVYLYFGFLDNLEVGAPVRIAGGIKIGQVNSIDQSIVKSQTKTKVTIWIDNKYKLVKSTKFAIFTKGMIGGKYINVFIPPVVNPKNYLRDGDTVYGMDPASFDQMMLTFQSFLHDQNGSEILAEIFQNARKFIANLNNITYENKGDVRVAVKSAKIMIQQMSAQANVILANLNKLSGNMAYLSEKNKEEITVTMKNLSELSKNLNKIVFRLEKGRGTLGKLLVEEDIYNNLKDASISAKDLFRALKKDPSKLLFKQKQK